MLKKLLAVSVIAALPAAAFADGTTVSGFADITYSQNTKAFGAAAEFDVISSVAKGATVRVDTDLMLDPAGAGNSAVLEQAYFAYAPIKAVTVIGGVFNNPIGWEEDDAPDMYTINGGQIRGIIDGQTNLYGNNIAGVALAGGAGPATITVAAVNDISGATDSDGDSKMSFAAIIGATPTKGLDLELGYVTQDGNAGNVWDINATYSSMGATLGLEVLGAENAVDLAWGALVNYEINPMFNVTARYDSVSYEASGSDNSTSYAVGAAFNAAKNLTVLVEYRDVTDANAAITGAAEGESAMVEFVATF